jgi:hypothetical protein
LQFALAANLAPDTFQPRSLANYANRHAEPRGDLVFGKKAGQDFRRRATRPRRRGEGINSGPVVREEIHGPPSSELRGRHGPDARTLRFWQLNGRPIEWEKRRLAALDLDPLETITRALEAARNPINLPELAPNLSSRYIVPRRRKMS